MISLLRSASAALYFLGLKLIDFIFGIGWWICNLLVFLCEGELQELFVLTVIQG